MDNSYRITTLEINRLLWASIWKQKTNKKRSLIQDTKTCDISDERLRCECTKVFSVGNRRRRLGALKYTHCLWTSSVPWCSLSAVSQLAQKDAADANLSYMKSRTCRRGGGITETKRSMFTSAKTSTLHSNNSTSASIPLSTFTPPPFSSPRGLQDLPSCSKIIS